MAKPKLNTTIDFPLNDGRTVKLTITWGLLIQLRSKSKHDYERYSKMVTGGVQNDVLGALTVVYIGYLCNYIDENGSADGAMSESQFAELAPNDYALVLNTMNELLSPKSKRDSVNPS